jgi:hypothetical protein
MKVAVVNLIKDIIDGKPCSRKDWSTISNALTEALESSQKAEDRGVHKQTIREIAASLENNADFCNEIGQPELGKMLNGSAQQLHALGHAPLVGIDHQVQPAICPYFRMLKVCVWRADVKCYAGPCSLMSSEQQALR